MNNATLILWVYIVLLELGGLMGFLKAGSKMSLIMSSVFAAALILCNLNILKVPHLVDGLLIFLFLFFSIRLTKSKKFMPNGLMSVLTLATIILLHVPLK